MAIPSPTPANPLDEALLRTQRQMEEAYSRRRYPYDIPTSPINAKIQMCRDLFCSMLEPFGFRVDMQVSMPAFGGERTARFLFRFEDRRTRRFFAKDYEIPLMQFDFMEEGALTSMIRGYAADTMVTCMREVAGDPGFAQRERERERQRQPVAAKSKPAEPVADQQPKTRRVISAPIVEGEA